MPANWTTLEARLDAIIDGAWGEPVELHPWTGGSYTSVGVPDPTRAVVKTTGVYMQPSARTVALAMAMGGANTAQLVEADVWLSVQEVNIGSLADWRAYDRVYFPNRNQWLSINYTAPSATGRPNIYLIRINENALPNAPSLGSPPSLRAASAKQ